MKRVSVVGTVHAEMGLANVSGLLAILERIGPEVIFQEIPAAPFDGVFTGELEQTAVARYGENHRVDLIPVDLPTPDGAFFAQHQELYARMLRTSPDYRRLHDEDRANVRARGFAYLNSQEYRDHLSELHEAMLAAIAKDVDHRRFTEIYDLCIGTDERRDREMMSNIEKHCRQASFSKAAFLVGAAHRPSLIALSRASSTIQWDFAGFLEEPNLTVAGTTRSCS